jgi:hypothetical protein
LRRIYRISFFTILSDRSYPALFSKCCNIKKPFNSKLYRKLLKKYKARNPEKLMDLLENDPLLSD